MSQLTLAYGVMLHKVDGDTARVFSPAKTVADGLKFRSQVWLDVALEALRDCYRQKKATMVQLWQAVCRMTYVMRPYLESRA